MVKNDDYNIYVVMITSIVQWSVVLLIFLRNVRSMFHKNLTNF